MDKNGKIKRLLPLPETSFFLLGPRGCGKSTWLKTQLPQARFVNLLDEGLYQSYLANPSLFYEALRPMKKGEWVAVDEIQRLPQLLNEVHRLIEEQRLKFALTGSSARKLKRSGVNLLAGRALRKEMFPLTPMEMKENFDFAKAMRFGTLPLIWNSPDPKESLKSYVQMYLKEEIQAEALVKNLPGFSRFIPVAALFHGQTLNIANVARDAEVKRPTAIGFFDILEDTLLAQRLPAFESKLRVREKKHSKFYWIDPGLARASRGDLSPPSAEETGSLFEGFVYMLLRFQKETFGEIDEISYWSPAEAKNTEVDFLLRKGREFIAIEVKATANLRPDHLKGLKAIDALKGVTRRIVVYLGKEVLAKDGGIEALPFQRFCDELATRKI